MANMVRVKSEQSVVPNEPTWQGILRLSEFDQYQGFAHVPIVYFYKNAAHSSRDDVVSILKDSLSRCLTHFYPIAGRIHRAVGGRMELHCNAMGAVLVEAEMNCKLADAVDMQLLMSEKYKHMNFAVDYTKPTHELALMYVQVTWFSCGGYSLGISVSHAVTDGMGAHHLISEWTRLARGKPVERTPYVKRDVLGEGEATGEPPNVKFLKEEKQVARPAIRDTTMVNLSLTRNQVEMLRTAARDGGMEAYQRPYSRFEVLTAHIWRCICKTKGQDGDQQTTIAFPVDSRTRLSPQLPPNFFGNASVLPLAVETRARDLISNPLGFGCSRVRSMVESVTSNYIWSNIESLKRVNNLGAMRNQGEPLVVSLLRVPAFGRDFGWGKEIRMGIGPHSGNTKILPGQGEDGSVLIAMCLKVDHVDKFKHHFYNF